MTMRPDGNAPDFKQVLEICLIQAGLTSKTLSRSLKREVKYDLPVNTVESWLRPHSMTGRPSRPRQETLQILAEWLCALPGVTVTEAEFHAAWLRIPRPIPTSEASETAAAGPLDRLRGLNRGESANGIIDATIYLGMDDLLGNVEHELTTVLNEKRAIPTYFMYLTHRGYLNWVARTEDEHYTYHSAGVELCKANAGDIAAEIVRAVAGNQIDYVALGPGTGTKDRAIVHALAGGVGPTNGSLYFYPFDINPALIVHAIQTVMRDDFPARVLVKGIIASFDSLALFSPVYKYRAGPNVLALFGNTLGNMTEDFTFLEIVHDSAMWPGDLFLLEVRCHIDKQAHHAPGMGAETKKRLNFGPLEILGASYDAHRGLITIGRERSRSVIPNTVTTVTRCQKVTCGTKVWTDVRLAYVHEYSEFDLDGVLLEIGYSIIKKYHGNIRGADRDRTLLLYLLQKP